MWDDFNRQYGFLGIGLAVIIVIMVFYFASSTQPVLNLNNKTGRMLYPTAPKDLRVPPNFITYFQSFLISVLLFVVMYIGMMRGKGLVDFITIEEAHAACDKYIENMVRLKDPAYTHCRVDKNLYNRLPWIYYTRDEPRAKKWLLVYKLVYDDGRPEQFLYMQVHPKNAKLMGAYFSPIPPDDSLHCSRCGQEYDAKVVDSADMAASKQIIADIAGARRL